MRRNSRDNRVRDYFYGKKSNLYPHIFEVKFSEIKIFKIGGKLIQCIYMYSPPIKKKCYHDISDTCTSTREWSKSSSLVPKKILRFQFYP